MVGEEVEAFTAVREHAGGGDVANVGAIRIAVHDFKVAIDSPRPAYLHRISLGCDQCAAVMGSGYRSSAASHAVRVGVPALCTQIYQFVVDRDAIKRSLETRGIGQRYCSSGCGAARPG